MSGGFLRGSVGGFPGGNGRRPVGGFSGESAEGFSVEVSFERFKKMIIGLTCLTQPSRH